MAVNKDKYTELMAALSDKATVVAVSKTKPKEDIEALYALGHRDFGENYVQELAEKQSQLAADIRWHFIGHLQTNKVKQIAGFVYLVHGVDSLKLLQEINKQGAKLNRTINVLLQIYIAKEESKFGLDEAELDSIFSNNLLEALPNICVCGLMGMASFTEDDKIVRAEFKYLKSLYDKYGALQITNSRFRFLSMGMSGDYTIALQEGSSMVRIGSLLFGTRENK